MALVCLPWPWLSQRSVTRLEGVAPSTCFRDDIARCEHVPTPARQIADKISVAAGASTFGDNPILPIMPEPARGRLTSPGGAAPSGAHHTRPFHERLADDAHRVEVLRAVEERCPRDRDQLALAAIREHGWRDRSSSSSDPGSAVEGLGQDPDRRRAGRFRRAASPSCRPGRHAHLGPQSRRTGPPQSG